MTHIKRIDEMAGVRKPKKVTNAEFSKFVKNITGKLQKQGAVVIWNDFGGRIDDSDFYDKVKQLPIWKRGAGMYPKLMMEKGYWEDTYYAFAKPCKEFVRLQKMLASKNIFLNEEDVKVVWIEGKRSVYDYDDFRFLCHNPDKCNEIMEWLKANKWRTHKVKMSIERQMNDSDRYDYDGEDMECEWSGSISYPLVLKLLTPTGRVSAEREFYVKYW